MPGLSDVHQGGLSSTVEAARPYAWLSRSTTVSNMSTLAKTLLLVDDGSALPQPALPPYLRAAPLRPPAFLALR